MIGRLVAPPPAWLARASRGLTVRRLPSRSVNTEADTPDQDHSREWYLDHVVVDAARFEAAVRVGPIDAPVAACPGWDLRQLTGHLGQVHRWATSCAANVAPPEDFAGLAPDPTLDAEALADWLAAG